MAVVPAVDKPFDPEPLEDPLFDKEAPVDDVADAEEDDAVEELVVPAAAVDAAICEVTTTVTGSRLDCPPFVCEAVTTEVMSFVEAGTDEAETTEVTT